jgi:uncharacterized membrane protein
MSDATGPHLAPSKVPDINTMTLGDIGYALRMGLRDFRRKPMIGLFFANVAVMGGWLIYVMLFLWHMEWLAIPLTFGFPLIGPFLVVGLYEVSRRLEAGQKEWRRNDIFGVIWRQRARQLPLMSWVIIVYYLFWSFFAHMLFALFLGPSVLMNVTSSYAYLLEPEGLRMLLVGTAFGAVFAFVLFALTAVSLPLLLEKELDFVTAMLTSIAVESGATTSAMPKPMAAVAGRTPSQTSCVPTPTPSPAKARATSIPPAPISRPGPYLSANRPDTVDRVEMKTESGAKTAEATASGVPQPAIIVIGRKNSTVDNAK